MIVASATISALAIFCFPFSLSISTTLSPPTSSIYSVSSCCSSSQRVLSGVPPADVCGTLGVNQLGQSTDCLVIARAEERHKTSLDSTTAETSCMNEEVDDRSRRTATLAGVYVWSPQQADRLLPDGDGRIDRLCCGYGRLEADGVDEVFKEEEQEEEGEITGHGNM
eukprot:GHVS01030549.1.p1 GENE.GHVS01030549.1~~GHVS01030549.1.p1  ORF type:complete len:167 (-),score=35.04 GHVS01030549.1:626-1126(-)